MLQEDSNGETTFEIIDKKSDDTANNSDKTESLSSVSSAYSIPSPSVVNLPVGNLLSNVAPPAALPDFTLWQSQNSPVPAPTPLPENLLASDSNVQPPSVPVPPLSQPYVPTQFSAAIPPSKGIQYAPPTQTMPESNQHTGGLIGWMKDAVSSSAILSKVAEKAKSSVDSLITTLDPQMSEFIYSGGDLEVTVILNDPEDVPPIRDAIYSILGKAWVNGVSSNVEEPKGQAVGLEEGFRRAEAKINASLQVHKTPTIACESILLNHNDNWFDLSVLVLKDADRNITVHTFTQTTPISVDVFEKQAQKEMPDFAKSCDSTEKLLAVYLQTCKNWQHSLTNVTRREVLNLAAKVLISTYKSKLVDNQ